MSIFKPIAKAIWPNATASLFSMSSANAALIDAGNGEINDTDINVTWTQDANLFYKQATGYAGGTAAFVAAVINSVPGGVLRDVGVGDLGAAPGNYQLSGSDFNTSTGVMNWYGAIAWAEYYLNSISYGGETGWRLPSMSPELTGYNQTDSEVGHLFYSELGGVARSSITNTHNTNYSLLSNLQSSPYWSGTKWSGTYYVMYFDTNSGFQFGTYKSVQLYSLAVRDGQVAAVSIPAAVWLMGSAVLGFIGFGRRREVTLNLGDLSIFEPLRGAAGSGTL